MRYEVELSGVKRQIDVSPDGQGWSVRVDGGPARRVDARQLGSTSWWLELEGGCRRVDVVVDGERAFVRDGSDVLLGEVIDPRRRALELGSGGEAGVVRSPMPGAVVRVLVQAGIAVHKGQVLVVVEAMKMENELRAVVDGVVAEVRVTAGMAVESGAVLVVMASV